MAPPRRLVSTGTTWEDQVGYSRAVRVGTVVHVAGTTAGLVDGRPMGGDDIGAQAMDALERIAGALVEVGASLEDVVRTRMYVTDISRWEEVASAHEAVFGSIRPVTSMVEVAALIDPALLVEIEAEAIVEDGTRTPLSGER
jgi:enamine deaminase RidA (YjgF/YER057c/UK114 family)